MLTKDTLDRIIELGQAPEIEVHGKTYTSRSLNVVREPLPSALVFHSLAGFADYVESGFDVAEKGSVAIQVLDESKVGLLGKLRETRDREVLAIVELLGDEFPFGVWGQHEETMIALQTRIVPTDNRAALLKILGSVTAEEVATKDDDGITQRVTAKAGVALVEKVDLPNPVLLRPYRTFREVDQPESPFVLRVRRGRGSGPEIALFESDGGAWRIDAISNVAEYLRDHTTGVPVFA